MPTNLASQCPCFHHPNIYTGYPSCCNHPNLSQLGTGTKLCWIAQTIVCHDKSTINFSVDIFIVIIIIITKTMTTILILHLWCSHHSIAIEIFHPVDFLNTCAGQTPTPRTSKLTDQGCESTYRLLHLPPTPFIFIIYYYYYLGQNKILT